MNSIPDYYMQVAWLPHSTCEFIDRMFRIFLWKGNYNSGVHLVGWNKITKLKKLGDLAIRKVREANKFMLDKLVWGLHRDCDFLWVQVLFWSISTSVRKRSLIWKRNYDQLLEIQLWKLSLLLKMTLSLDWEMKFIFLIFKLVWDREISGAGSLFGYPWPGDVSEWCLVERELKLQFIIY